LSFTDDREGRRRRKSDTESSPSAAPSRSRRKRPPPGEVGHALRSAYQRMVEEDIPPEMLDLLGKLG
jgi:Anti-sigma factor NepR